MQQSAEFTISPQNETGMTLFANNSISGEYNNGGAIFAKENSTINLANVIFGSNVAGGYGGAIYSAGTNDAGDMDLNITNAIFTNNIANDGKGGAIYSINNDIYLSDVILIIIRHIHQPAIVMGTAVPLMLRIIVRITHILQEKR